MRLPFISFMMLCLASPSLAAESLSLAKDGRALVGIVVSEKASDRVSKAARTLSIYFERISGAKFEVSTGDGATGIAIGRSGDFPALPFKDLFDLKDPTRTEDYLLRSHGKGLYAIGASDLAVENAVWDLLDRLGYRQFFPSAAWEVVPKEKDLRIAVDAKEHPSYYSRRIWFGFGAAPWAKEAYLSWCAKNRAVDGIEIHSGHAYDGIISRNKAEFAKHPEYFGLLNGERKSSKICIGNPAVRQLVCDDALRQFAAKPDQQCVSVDPSDGGGWCECDDCKKLGSVSNRALTLANEVATAVEKKHPDKFVAMYAYSQHSPPPTIKVHPRVVINVATSFITGGYTVDQLIEGWQKQGATVGIREYYSVHTWDRDLPGKARGANPAYLVRTIPHFHELGARFLSAESSDNWGCNGLGYYLAARILWNVESAKRIDELKDDFLTRSFGPAKKPMAEFYWMIDAVSRPLLTDDLVGRMYRKLDEARKMTDNPGVRGRLNELVLYTRYVEIWLDYASTAGDLRQKSWELLARHALRIRKSEMVHTLGLIRDLPGRDKSLTVPEDAKNFRIEKGSWVSNEPFTEAEIAGILEEGIDRRQLFNFMPVSFSENLVPVAKLQLPNVAQGTFGGYSRGTRVYFTWIDNVPATIDLKASGGRIYGNRGEAKIALYPNDEPEGKAIAEATIAPDKIERDVTLKTTFKGLHRLEISDRMAGSTLTWKEGRPMTIASSPDSPVAFQGRWTAYFYVPKGTKTIGGYSGGAGLLLDPASKTAHTFPAKAAYFSIPVPAGQDGKLWKFQNSIGQRLLMTVPPYLARDDKELMLPAEVVEKDGEK